MFCYQCQETANGSGCGVRGVCGKTEDVANLQDLLIYNLKGLSVLAVRAKQKAIDTAEVDRFIIESLFATITNVNFSKKSFVKRIRALISFKDKFKSLLNLNDVESTQLHDAVNWTAQTEIEFDEKAKSIGVLRTEDVDIRSLRELLVYGLKGIAAYADHAYVLDNEDPKIYEFIEKALAATLDDSLSADQLVELVIECGKFGVDAMALLDKANTQKYGHPEITKVNIGVRKNPGILISGHDLRDMHDLLEQTRGTGVDVYTHGEMLPANYYPEFKKYDNLVGNYGSSWWLQNKEFETFNGPILMTTNCIVQPKDSYKDRIFTTGVAGFDGVKNIDNRNGKKQKDFSEIIALAKKCPAPTEIETGEIIGGFAHNQVFALADKVVEAVKSGVIKRFIVMAGCDGRHKTRDYFTKVAESLPNDTIILTAGCAKYRYNKLKLGDLGGIPRVLDAGQCNDSYSLAVIALKLKEVFELDDVNKLPISFDIAWYEQKAVIVLLALLYLGFKGMRLGPTLPAFLSLNVAKVLVEKFDIKPIGDVKQDVYDMMMGR
ncbi:MAG: hydroxylamine reductase [Candidatus Omnitrophica bacterium]|nr:hydroxylamine reductase [Candidatus Omnitrophota bacterium]MDD5441587.1 hydroxylamine reductase [Candidatus Omnitrophota bacterium]